MDHGDTSTRLVWAADFHRKHPTASQARIQQELKNKFGMGIRTQSMDGIFKGDGISRPRKKSA